MFISDGDKLRDVCHARHGRVNPVVINLLGTGANSTEKMFAGHMADNTYIFYLCMIKDNTLSSVVPISGKKNFFKIHLKDLNDSNKM